MVEKESVEIVIIFVVVLVFFAIIILFLVNLRIRSNILSGLPWIRAFVEIILGLLGLKG
jgi:hypothetical protein